MLLLFPFQYTRGGGAVGRKEAFLFPYLDIKELLKCQGLPFFSEHAFLLLKRLPLNLSLRMTGVHQDLSRAMNFTLRLRLLWSAFKHNRWYPTPTLSVRVLPKVTGSFSHVNKSFEI